MTRYAIRSIALCAALILTSCALLYAQEHDSSSTPVTVSSTTNAAPKNAPPTTIKAKSQLVLVPTIVNHDGAPVTGLKKEDFKIFENGKEKKVAVFEEIKADSSPVTVNTRRQPAIRQFSNMQIDQDQPKRLVIIVIDLMNTPFSDRVYARQQLVKYLSSGIDNGALVSLVALGRGRVRILHDFTSSPDVLVAALNKVHGTFDPAAAPANIPPDQTKIFESEVNQISTFLETGKFSGMRFGSAGADSAERWFRIRETLDGLNLIAQAYAGIPGRKALVWASGGFPFQIDGSTMLLNPGQMKNANVEDLSSIMPYYQQTWQLMNNANFAIYPVDIRGLVTTNIGADQRVTGSARNIVRQTQRKELINQDTLATFDTFANMTGGRAFYNTNDLAQSFKQATIDSASYYLLGYYLDDSATNDKKKSWRGLKVKVDAPKTSVRARSGFFVNDSNDSYLRDEIDLALSSPLDFTGLPVTVRWLDPADAAQPENVSATPAPKKLNFEVSLPPNAVTIDTSDSNSLSLRIVASARTPDAVVANGVSQTITGHLKQESVEKMRTSGFTFKGDIALPPGRYSVRFVVHDNASGRTGSVAAPVTVN